MKPDMDRWCDTNLLGRFWVLGRQRAEEAEQRVDSANLNVAGRAYRARFVGWWVEVYEWRYTAPAEAAKREQP